MRKFTFIFLSILSIACKNNALENFNLEKLKILRNDNKDSFLLVSSHLLKSSKLRLIDKSNILTQLGHFHYDNSNFDSAYLFYQKAYSLRREIGDSEAMLNSIASIADVLSEKGETQKAISFYEETITKRKEKKNLCDDYTNLANLLSNKGLNIKAAVCFKKAIYFAKEINDSYRISRSYYNYCLFNSSIDQFDSAVYYLDESNKIDIYAAVPNNQINFLLAKAHIYSNKSDYKNAKIFYDSSVIFSFHNNLRNERLYAIRGLTAITESQNKLKETNDYFKWQISLSDSLFSENIQNSIANLEVKYDTERKERENYFLSKENRNQHSLLIAAGLALILLLLALIFSYTTFKNKRKKTLAETNLNINKILEEVNQTKMEAWADGQEKERTRLAGELHDRLGGLLVMASHHFTGIEKKFDSIKKENETTFSDFRKIINNAIIEVRELSKDISSNLVTKLGLSNAMMDLKEKIETATNLSVNLSIHNAEKKIPLSKEIALFRIAQEALNNVMKHSQANTVQLSLIGNENSIVLMIEDNGKGFETSKSINFSGIGLKSMQKRMTDIGGTLNIDSKIGRGTVLVAEVEL
ncbi:MAG: sensor histidine kinase [bacterium]|nr:sensor histidine kinase [bacterium]